MNTCTCLRNLNPGVSVSSETIAIQALLLFSDVDEINGGEHYSWDDTDGNFVTGLTPEQIRDAYGKVLYICDVSINCIFK